MYVPYKCSTKSQARLLGCGSYQMMTKAKCQRICNVQMVGNPNVTPNFLLHSKGKQHQHMYKQECSITVTVAMCRALIFPQLSHSHLPPHEILYFKAICSSIHSLWKISWRELYMYTLMWEHHLVSLAMRRINLRASCTWSWVWFCTFQFFILQLHTV